MPRGGIFATSREHDIHHASREPRNISVMLSICDRMFGTFEKARRTAPVSRVG